ncbi:CST complex subunit TEN1 [Phytophthora cinnamomi]|uniref:CST complex subunit TEN1 n=1 Tax=Phytophthora cinnamomi TaxID=4785 RepID=UPI00355AC309|nr:CST complex subunit TEN1 [Phytophthora cinnamomi]
MVAPPGCCEICQIAEVLADPQLQNRSVRITGRLAAYDAQRKLATVTFQDVSMTVETQRMALGNLRLQIGSMYQFLGETYSSNQAGQTEVRLVARVGRNVDSLDIDLFLEALAMRRQFLASRG